MILIYWCIVGEAGQDEVAKLIHGYIKEIEVLRSKLVESEAVVEVMKRSPTRTPSRMMSSSPMMAHTAGPNLSMDFSYVSPDNQVNHLIADAKKQVKALKKKVRLNSQR